MTLKHVCVTFSFSSCLSSVLRGAPLPFPRGTGEPRGVLLRPHIGSCFPSARRDSCDPCEMRWDRTGRDGTGWSGHWFASWEMLSAAPAVTASITAPSSNRCSLLTVIITRGATQNLSGASSGKCFPILPSGTAALHGSTALCRWRALQRLWLSSGTGVGSGSDREGLCPIPVRVRAKSAEEKQLRSIRETVRTSLPLGRCRWSGSASRFERRGWGWQACRCRRRGPLPVLLSRPFSQGIY